MFPYQTILVTIIVLAAAVYVAREIWRAVFTPSGGACGSCSSCDGKESGSAEAKQLVTLDDRTGGRAD